MGNVCKDISVRGCYGYFSVRKSTHLLYCVEEQTYAHNNKLLPSQSCSKLVIFLYHYISKQSICEYIITNS